MTRILIVEDSFLAARGLEAALRERGHDVSIAIDADEARRILRSFRPSVVVTDYMMSLTTGQEFISQLRRDPANADVVAILASAMPESKLRRLVKGYDHYLAKPVDADALCSLINAGSSTSPPVVRRQEEADAPATETRDVRDDDQARLRLLEAAVAKVSDVILITSATDLDAPHGPEIVFVNDAVEGATGYSPRELIGKTPRIFQGEATSRRELDRLRKALEASEHVHVELVNYTKTGRPFNVAIDIAPLFNGEGRCTHFVSVQRDVTERTRGFRELRMSEERFRLVAQATDLIVWDLNPRTGRFWWNERINGAFGYFPADVACFEDWIAKILPADRDRISALWARALEGQSQSWVEEYAVLKADGSVANLVEHGFAVADPNGRPARVVGSIDDITRRREMEGRLRQTERLEAAATLTAGIAHDFRNLLTIIVGNAELLVEGLPESDPQRKLANSVLVAAQRGAGLVESLLTFAKTQSLQPEQVDLTCFLASSVRLFETLLPHGIRLETEVVGTPAVYVDPRRLELALLNLIFNARDVMSGGGTILVRAAPSAAAGFTRLEVRDEGPGIPPALLSRIFDPFVTTKPRGEGTGLGLSIVHGFVLQSGGRIDLNSSSQGTSIVMDLPAGYS